jgi:hypothetical protein
MNRVLPPTVFALVMFLLFSCASASAATSVGGACPSGVTAGVTSCFFIAANGLDSNSGTSESSPWLHAPGMASCSGSCAAVTPAAGQGFIFRGGDTWHYGNSSLSPFVAFASQAWNWTWSGSSTNCNLNAAAGAITTSSCIYIGVDPSWYSSNCGSSWCRPIMNMDNPLSTSSPSSCPYDDSSYNLIHINGSYIIFDNFEIKGYCWNSTAPGTSVFTINTETDLRNSYFHGWTMGATATGCGSCDSDEYFAVGYSGYALGSYSRIDYNVFDGSDSTYGTSTTSSSGGVFQTGAGEIDHNILNHVSNGMKYDQAILVHDNLFENMYEPVVTGTHGNIMEWSPANYTNSTYYFNNLTNTTGEGESVDMYPGSNSSSKYGYVFNNISWANGNATNCYLTEGGGTGGPGPFEFSTIRPTTLA